MSSTVLPIPKQVVLSERHNKIPTANYKSYLKSDVVKENSYTCLVELYRNTTDTATGSCPDDIKKTAGKKADKSQLPRILRV